jgi:hypothetical protein
MALELNIPGLKVYNCCQCVGRVGRGCVRGSQRSVPIRDAGPATTRGRSAATSTHGEHNHAAVESAHAVEEQQGAGYAAARDATR